MNKKILLPVVCLLILLFSVGDALAWRGYGHRGYGHHGHRRSGRNVIVVPLPFPPFSYSYHDIFKLTVLNGISDKRVSNPLMDVFVDGNMVQENVLPGDTWVYETSVYSGDNVEIAVVVKIKDGDRFIRATSRTYRLYKYQRDERSRVQSRTWIVR